MFHFRLGMFHFLDVRETELGISCIIFFLQAQMDRHRYQSIDGQSIGTQGLLLIAGTCFLGTAFIIFASTPSAVENFVHSPAKPLVHTTPLRYESTISTTGRSATISQLHNSHPGQPVSGTAEGKQTVLNSVCQKTHVSTHLLRIGLPGGCASVGCYGTSSLDSPAHTCITAKPCVEHGHSYLTRGRCIFL